MEFYWEAKDDKWFLRPAVEAPEQASITSSRRTGIGS